MPKTRSTPKPPMSLATFQDDELLLASEVAQVLRISRSTIYDLMRSGRLPCVEISRGLSRACRRWRVGDVRALISGVSPPNQPANRARARR